MLNNCWRSVPLPCGQYMAIFIIIIVRRSSPQWKLLFSRRRRSAAEQFTIKLPLPARAEYALRSGHICASLWSMWISHLCKYATMWSMWISSGHNLCIKLTQGLLCPPLHWLTLSLRSKSMLYLKDRIVKTCKRKTKSHQSSSCEFKLVAIETNWLTKLLRHVVSCHRRALSVINSDYLIQRIFPHCHNIGSDSNIFGSLFCMWVQKVLTIETNWATKCRVIKAHYQWLTLTND